MKKISALIVVIAGLLAVATPKVLAPVCTSSLECVNGNFVPMKCHWYAVTLVIMGGLLVLAGLVMLVLRETKSAALVVILLGAAILAFSNGSIGIGVCMNTEMMCQKTLLFGRIAAIIAIAGGVLGLFGKGKEEK